MFVDVTFPISSYKTFVYKIPKSLINGVQVGIRVRVPFRNSVALGFVTNIKKSTDIVHNVDDGSVTSSIILSALNKPLEDYKKKYPEINQIYWWNISPKFHIQRYYPNEGYFYPHAEVTDISSAMRVLVWMFYLNDVNDGGTKFTNYNKIINATKGRLVIWTPYWTHTHHGIISSTQTKYIATGWYSFIE